MCNKFLLINKPFSISSFNFIKPLKKSFEKVGHSGTLDPYATGLLVVATNRATKFLRFLPNLKEYLFSIKFGIKTETDDLDGLIIERNNFIPDERSILNILPNFVGNIFQTPSKFSAIKVNGKRAYSLVRRGINFQLLKREVSIKNLTLLSFNREQGIGDFKVSCSKGTYIRSLCVDICNFLGCIGCVIRLHRTFSDGFSIDGDESYDLEYLTSFYPSITIEESLLWELKNGKKVSTCFQNGNYCLICNSFVGMVEVKNGIIHSLKLV